MIALLIQIVYYESYGIDVSFRTEAKQGAPTAYTWPNGFIGSLIIFSLSTLQLFLWMKNNNYLSAASICNIAISITNAYFICTMIAFFGSVSDFVSQAGRGVETAPVINNTTYSLTYDSCFQGRNASSFFCYYLDINDYKCPKNNPNSSLYDDVYETFFSCLSFSSSTSGDYYSCSNAEDYANMSFTVNILYFIMLFFDIILIGFFGNTCCRTLCPKDCK